MGINSPDIDKADRDQAIDEIEWFCAMFEAQPVRGHD
jgi:hypothetical protein